MSRLDFGLSVGSRGVGQWLESFRSTQRKRPSGRGRWTSGGRLRAQRRSVCRRGACGPGAAPLCSVSVPPARGGPPLDLGGHRGRARPVRHASTAHRNPEAARVYEAIGFQPSARAETIPTSWSCCHPLSVPRIEDDVIQSPCMPRPSWAGTTVGVQQSSARFARHRDPLASPTAASRPTRWGPGAAGFRTGDSGRTTLPAPVLSDGARPASRSPRWSSIRREGAFAPSSRLLPVWPARVGSRRSRSALHRSFSGARLGCRHGFLLGDTPLRFSKPFKRDGPRASKLCASPRGGEAQGSTGLMAGNRGPSAQVTRFAYALMFLESERIYLIAPVRDWRRG